MCSPFNLRNAVLTISSRSSMWTGFFVQLHRKNLAISTDLAGHLLGPVRPIPRSLKLNVFWGWILRKKKGFWDPQFILLIIQFLLVIIPSLLNLDSFVHIIFLKNWGSSCILIDILSQNSARLTLSPGWRSWTRNNEKKCNLCCFKKRITTGPNHLQRALLSHED